MSENELKQELIKNVVEQMEKNNIKEKAHGTILQCLDYIDSHPESKPHILIKKDKQEIILVF